ncbi:MAG: hypothetical protein ACRCVJ_18630 [Clostridium sp.]|uniref:hypothetical protein n=1 Tax=Clostridium sp. TaxID=1506 RepID=UPI003F336E26
MNIKNNSNLIEILKDIEISETVDIGEEIEKMINNTLKVYGVDECDSINFTKVHQQQDLQRDCEQIFKSLGNDEYYDKRKMFSNELVYSREFNDISTLCGSDCHMFHEIYQHEYEGVSCCSYDYDKLSLKFEYSGDSSKLYAKCVIPKANECYTKDYLHCVIFVDMEYYQHKNVIVNWNKCNIEVFIYNCT